MGSAKGAYSSNLDNIVLVTICSKRDLSIKIETSIIHMEWGRGGGRNGIQNNSDEYGVG